MTLPLAAAIFTFAAVFFLAAGSLAALEKRRSLVASRLDRYTGQNLHAPAKDDVLQLKKDDRSPLRRAFRSLGRLLAPRSWQKKADAELARAGLPLKAEEYLVLHVMLFFSVPALLYFLSGSLLFTILSLLPVAVLPPILLKRSRIKRLELFTRQLSDGLMIIANSLRAGFSFLQSVDTVCREMPAPLAEEFSRMLKEMNLGVTTEEALQNLAERLDSEDLDLVVTAVLIQRQVGGNLSEVLDRIGDTIRQRITFARELKTLTAQGRMSGLIVGLLPFFILIMISLINPTYLNVLFEEPLGLALLAWAGCSQIIGFLLIRKIVSIDY